jgi:hypothetical protein
MPSTQGPELLPMYGRSTERPYIGNKISAIQSTHNQRLFVGQYLLDYP